MERGECEALAGRLAGRIELTMSAMEEMLPDGEYRKGMLRGLKMALRYVRDNHPKEDDE